LLVEVILAQNEPVGSEATRRPEKESWLMERSSGFLRIFCRDEAGAALIEYTVLLGILLVAVFAVIGGVGDWVAGIWATTNSTLP
jgi:pilus assembly protein Flp/PilA